jgi:hypothetical protein
MLLPLSYVLTRVNRAKMENHLRNNKKLHSSLNAMSLQVKKFSSKYENWVDELNNLKIK